MLDLALGLAIKAGLQILGDCHWLLELVDGLRIAGVSRCSETGILASSTIDAAWM
jgi:hypothetical protein